MTRAAAIDIGTNSVLLLVAERSEGEIVPVLERATITRLGRGVDATRRLDPVAIEDTLACIAAYGAEISRLGVERLDVVGTSAMRDAAGGAELVARAADALGTTPRVATGDEEARLTFEGALGGLGLGSGPIAVFDVGGGSTEIVSGRLVAGGAEVEHAASIDVGAVRMTERCIDGDPPTTAALSRVRSVVRAALASAAGLVPGGRLVGVAGTVTTLAAIAGGVVPYSSDRIHGSRLRISDVDALATRLAALPLEERRKVPGLEPKRADVIVAGALVVIEVARACAAADVVVSDRGVRWGLVQRLLRDPSPGGQSIRRSTRASS